MAVSRVLRSSALWDGFFRENPAGMFVLAPLHDEQGGLADFEVLAANPALLQMAGRAAGEVLGKPLSELLKGADNGDGSGDGQPLRRYARAFRRGSADEFEQLLPFSGLAAEQPGWHDVSVLPVDGRLLVSVRSIDRRKSVLIQAIRLMNVDDLTGIGNRRHLRNHFWRLRQRGRGIALVFLDLNGFKSVNDSHGHETGDEVLKIVAQRLSNGIRPGEAAARLGGDEFAVLLDTADRGAAAAVAERLRHSVSLPVSVSGVTVQVATSLGVALFPDDGDSFEALCAAADRLMYEDKARVLARRAPPDEAGR